MIVKGNIKHQQTSTNINKHQQKVMDFPSDFAKLLDILERNLLAEYTKFDYDDDDNDNIFASESLTKNFAFFVCNFVSHRKDDVRYSVWISDLTRLLSPHSFNGEIFTDSFGVKDVLEDISLYRESRWLFLHYELTERKSNDDTDNPREEWKLIATFSNLNTAFRTRRDISPERHHFTKVYFRPVATDKQDDSNDKDDSKLDSKVDSNDNHGQKYEHFGRRIFPSSMI